jgi:hypothetical protein
MICHAVADITLQGEQPMATGARNVKARLRGTGLED